MHVILAAFLLLSAPALLLSVPTPASAQARLGTRAALPAPVKPSDVVVLRNSQGSLQPCGNGMSGVHVDLQISSSLGTTPFSVPAGKVLVLTHFDYVLGSGSGADLVVLLIYQTGGTGNMDVFSIVTGGSQASGTFDLGAVVVKPGLGLCVWKTGTFTGGGAHARGYLADDE